MSYPRLENASPLLAAMQGRREFGFCPHEGTTLASLCYNIAEKDTFDDPLRRELRGVLIDTATNQIVLRPFHKFFNVGERPETQINVIREHYPDRQQGYCIEHKTDGTMVAATIYHDRLLVATKRALISDPFYDRIEGVVRDICASYGNVTVIFERAFQKLRAEHQHLLEYDQDHLVLLAIRDNVTGEYLNTYEWEEESEINLKVESGDIRLKDFDVFKDFDELLAAQATRTEREGWVLTDGVDFFKLKTDWYIKRHHIVGNLSERSIAKFVLSETIDDVLSYLSTRFADSPVLEKAEYAATKVSSDYNLWLATVDALVRRYDGVEMRDLVNVVDKDDLFLINKRRKGHDFDWKGQFFKLYKHRYTCDLFYNLEVD